MKKFRFTLNTVLDYKDQVLDTIRAEHGAVLARVRRQERAVEEVRERYCLSNGEFREKKAAGMTVADALGYESSLRALDREIQREERKLEALRAEEAAKRAEVVEARKETASLEKLKEKKLQAYNRELLKYEERLIDELVSAARVSAAQTAP